MKFIPLGNSDARLVVRNDDRGNLARTWCVNSFLEQGIDFRPAQDNTSFTGIRGTVQGMHFRRAPKADAKLVRCMGVEYVPDLYAGFRYDDSMIGIPWPETVAALSANDAAGHC